MSRAQAKASVIVKDSAQSSWKWCRQDCRSSAMGRESLVCATASCGKRNEHAER